MESEGEAAPESQAEEAEEAAIPEVAPVARLLSKADPSKEFAVASGSNTIGRREGNDIALSEDSYVSGSHAELIADERGFWLVDVGSTNGTMLNGSRIEPNTRMALNDGDEITIGQTAFEFEVLKQAEVEPGELAEADSPESGDMSEEESEA